MHRHDTYSNGPIGSASLESLSPDYVSVGGSAWASDAPVLPLEGLAPWEKVRAPSLDLDDEEAPVELSPETRDPAQLELVPAGTIPGQASRAAGAASGTVAAGAPSAAEAAAAAPAAPVDGVELTYARAKAAAEANHRADAKDLYRQVLSQRPDHVRARNNLALLLEADGNHEGALAEFDRALEIDPDNATLLVNRGALLGQMGRFAASERDLRRVLRTEPSHLEALFSLGVILSKKGLWSEALSPLRRVIEMDPQRGPAHFYLGEALNHVDDLAGAMASYLRAAELMPDHPRALYGLGIIYDRTGRPDDAARMYRKSRDVARR